MSHPVRRWLKDLVQYGRRSVATPADGRPPLLWVADLPRLGRMWLGHYWFRTWLDLRTTPPRVVHRPREVFSPHVRLIRPTKLNPIRPLRRTKDVVGAARLWFAAGGVERVVGTLRRGMAELSAGFGVLFFGALRVVGGLFAGAVGLFGASAIGTALGLNAIGGGVRRSGRRAAATGSAFVTSTSDRLSRLAGGFRSPREIAWTFATLTGTVGLILLMVLQASGLSAASKHVAAEQHVAHRSPLALAQVEPADDTFGGFPDPFGAAPADVAEFGEDPFGPVPVIQAEPVPPIKPEPEPAADLDVEFARATPPSDVATFNVADDDEQFVVTSSGIDPAVNAVDFPADDWLRAIPRDEIARPQIVPAAYRELSEHPLLGTPLPQPSPFVDQAMPASRLIGVGIRKTLPADAKQGELLWYDLIVTNNSDDAVGGVIIEEKVGEPHRVAEAQPAATFADGVLTWRLEELGPREERRLSVAVFPMSDDPITTTATVRPAATVAALTVVEAVQPARPEPLPTRPEPVPEPEQPSEFRRIRIEMTTPDRAAVGADCVIHFAVTNTGGASLTGVAIQAILPEGLAHRHGVVVESLLGELAPGETKHVELHATAGTPGEPELIAQVAAAEGVATTVEGSFTIVESLATNSGSPACCSPVGFMADPFRR